jgi:hypothetical protein
VPALTWNIQKVAQPVFVEYSARDTINFLVAAPGGGVTTRIAPLAADLQEKIPTGFARNVLIAWNTTIVAGNIILRKYHNAGLAFVDEAFAIGAVANGVASSILPLECAEVYVQNNDVGAGTIRVTVIARA